MKKILALVCVLALMVGCVSFVGAEELADVTYWRGELARSACATYAETLWFQHLNEVMAKEGINIDMIIQSGSTGAKTNMTFTVPDTEFEKAKKAVENNKEILKYESFIFDRKVVKVSIVGIGMGSHSGVAEIMFKTLAEKNINVMAISTSEIKISVLIADEYTELALRALHTAFGLDEENAD